ncbi:oxysterol-binding protein 1-like isoform X4 [Hermetia illucens]|uniref:oxysterol-binding protein 1-like isoform X4 n=1 Tax=Hermetia illucens TaxID=343691 RepID=UPI0018CC645F|nr:oxysterol-binding protein 1-like isoform X4 [Hermetia illucens]
MGYLTEIFCCSRKRQRESVFKIHPTSHGKCIQKQRRRNIPKRPKEQCIPLIKYLQYSSEGKRSFVPVTTYEPLSLLQKLAEPFEYSFLLDKAAGTGNYAEQMKYIAAFSHVYAMKVCERISRPFDPLLGETFEMNRSDDMGFKFIAEQISVAPKVAALHCAGIGWIFQSNFEYTFNIQTKFISINPVIRTTIFLKDYGSEFAWPMALTYRLHNILFGEVFFDVFGAVEITEKKHSGRYSCRMEYFSKFSKKHDNSPDVVGSITRNKKPVINLRGFWEKGLESFQQYIAPNLKAEWTILWEYRPMSKDREDYYYFTEYVAQLNELESCIAPTDSRLRPDIRNLENGKIKIGNAHKRRMKLLKYINTSPAN